MNLVVKHFGIILGGIILILLGIDIVILNYFAIGLSIIISFNLVLIGLVILYRGIREPNREEKRFYSIWALLFMDLSISIFVSTTLYNTVIGLAIFLIGLGIIAVYTAVKL